MPRLFAGLIPLYAFQKAALRELSEKLQIHHRGRVEIAQFRIALGEFPGNEIESFGRRHRDVAVQTRGGI
jgi:hypothetical protein